MRKYVFMSMLCMAIGGHFLASANVVRQAKQKAPNTVQKPNQAIGKPVTQKPATKEPAHAAKLQNPKAQNKPLHNEHSSFFSSSSDADCCKQACCQYVISSKDINKGKGVIIDKPGIWCLDGNACFNPKPSQYLPPDPRAVQAAITVKAGVSNVIIDLCNYRLSQTGSGTSTQTPYVIGILVPDPDPTNPDPEFVGAESIYIKGDDAIIDGFSMFGIRIFAHTRDIQISDLTVKNCGTLASKALRPFPSYIPHSVSQNANFVPPANNAMLVAGIAIGETATTGMGPQFFTDPALPVYRASSISLENVTCLDNFYRGLFAACLTDVSIENCHFDGTWSDQEAIPELDGTAPLPAGFEFTNDQTGDHDGIINMKVLNSTFNNTQARGNESIPLGYGYMGGALGFNSLNVTWENCQFNGTSNTFGNTDFRSFTAGFICGGIFDTTFDNCTCDGIKAASGAQGLHISGSGSTRGSKNTVIRNCSFRNIQQTGTQLPITLPPVGSLQAVGIWNNGANNVTIDNCVVSDIIANGPMLENSFVTGIFIFTFQGNRISENTVIKDCVVQRCLALNGGQTRGISVYVPNTIPVLQTRAIDLENCVVEGCVTYPGSGTIPGIQSISCGYYFEGDSALDLDDRRDFPWSLNNCKALRNKGVASALIGAVTQYSAGFYFLGAQRASVYKCEALDNIYGFFLQKSDRCAIRECRADNNLLAGSNIGEGFTDVGPAGTAALPQQSTSMFEGNSAYSNGAGTAHVGPNGNYNIWVNAGTSIRPLLLECVNATSACVIDPTNPGGIYLAGKHNLSTVN